MGLVSVVTFTLLAGGIISVFLLGWCSARKAVVAAGLIGEIAEILTVVEAHHLSEAIRATRE